MKNRIFTGCGTALITPMKVNGEVDYEALKRIVRQQIEAEIDALVVCGTTGEAPTLKIEEHLKVIEKVIEYAKGKTKIIAGTGSNDTLHSVETCRAAAKLGADAVLSVTPYYNRPTQDGLIKHYTYIADNAGIPVILYNVPSRTGTNMFPETYKVLAEHPNIAAVKEANGDIGSVLKTRALCGDKLDIYTGNDNQIVPTLSLGGIGVISVVSNILPRETREMCLAFFEGDANRAAELQIKYAELIEALFIESNPIMIKEAMSILGLCTNKIRLPLVNPTAAHREILVNSMKKVGLI